MSSTTVHVKNISSATSEKEVREFFSFCGKITQLTLTPTSGEPNAPKSATITFERDSAAKTAVLLDGTPLNSSPLHVEANPSLDELAGDHITTDPTVEGEPEPRQESKPRTAILAEYLAHGYLIGDQTLQKGIELDQKHGISAKFMSYLSGALQTIESKTHATDRAKTFNTQYGVTAKATAGKSSLQRYFEKAIGTPTGQKIRQFYQEGEKQVLDIHNEARRLAELKKQGHAGVGPSADGKPLVGDEQQTVCSCGGSEGVCSCAPGKCACANCAKPGDKSQAGTAASISAQAGHAGTDVKETAKDIAGAAQ